MKHYNLSPADEGTSLESPRINYVSRKAKGVYANILLDDWLYNGEQESRI